MSDCAHDFDGSTCSICGTNMTELMKKEAQWLMEYGWYANYVQPSENEPKGDDRSPTGFNYHTHGLVDSLDHMDLQIVIGIQHDIAHGVFRSAVDEIKAGQVFEDGDLAGCIIKNLDVAFIKAQEGARDVLRIIIPDPTGSLDRQEMHEDYAVQYELVEQDEE